MFFRKMSQSMLTLGAKLRIKLEFKKYKISMPLVYLVLQDGTKNIEREGETQLKMLSKGNGVLLFYHNKFFDLGKFSCVKCLLSSQASKLRMSIKR